MRRFLFRSDRRGERRFLVLDLLKKTGPDAEKFLGHPFDGAVRRPEEPDGKLSLLLLDRKAHQLRIAAGKAFVQVSDSGIAFQKPQQTGKLIHIAAWKNAVNLGLSDRIGSLRPGKLADIAVFRPCRRRNIFGDRPFSNENAEFREGDLVYEPVLMVKAGEMVWRSVTF